MVKVTEADTERNGFMSWPGEKHASIAGVTPGFILGLTWGGPHQSEAFGIVTTVVAIAYGTSTKKRKSSNKKLTTQMKQEAPYVLGGLITGLVLGLVANVLLKGVGM